MKLTHASFKMLVALAIAVLSIWSPAASAGDVSGLWIVRAEGRALMKFDITRKGASWTARWTQPDRYSTDGEVFRAVGAGVQRRDAREVRTIDGVVEMVFDSPWQGGRPDRFVIKSSGEA